MLTKNSSPLSLSSTLTKRCLLLCLLALACASQGAAQRAAENNGGHTFQRTRTLLDELPAQIKSMDEPALRVFLRLRLAGFLWSRDFQETSNKASTICLEALADLQAHKTDIPEYDLNWFRKDILSLLEIHSPELAARAIKQYGLEPNGDAQKVEAALSSLDSGGDAKAAVEKVREVLNSGQNPNLIMTFFLDRLKQERPSEVPPLLASILTIEEQKPGSISPQNFIFFLHLYLSKETPPALQERFLKVALKATSGSFAGADQSQLKDAYSLLRAILPAVEKRLPVPVYAQASAQLSALAARLPDLSLELQSEALNKRIEQSADPLNQMLTEADATKDSTLKNRLRTDAAQLALRKGQLKLAVELVMRVESNRTHHVSWRDGFLRQVVDRAIEKKDTAVADYAIAQINSPFYRVHALEKLALYFFEAGDSVSSLERLKDALKHIDAIEYDINQATALLGIIPAFARVDGQRVPELARAAIKTINNIQTPQPGDKPGSEARQNYVGTLIQISEAVVPAFKSLAQTDEIGALGLAQDLQRQDIKAAATLGVAQGLYKTEASAISMMLPQ
jgi:hypothetical protein